MYKYSKYVHKQYINLSRLPSAKKVLEHERRKDSYVCSSSGTARQYAVQETRGSRFL